MKIKLEFPVLGVSEDSLVAYRDFEELSICSGKAIKDGYFKRLVLIDRNGMRAEIKSLQMPRGIVPTLKRFFGCKLRVDLEMQLTGKTTLVEMREIVIRVVSKDREFWEAASSFEELSKDISNANANAHSEIIERFY